MKNQFKVFILCQGWRAEGFLDFIFKVPYQTTVFFLMFLETMKQATSHFSNTYTKEEKAKEDAGENKTSPFQKAPKERQRTN